MKYVIAEDWKQKCKSSAGVSMFSTKDQISEVLGFLWNNENKSCLNDIKFWEVSGNLKTNKLFVAWPRRSGPILT